MAILPLAPHRPGRQVLLAGGDAPAEHTLMAGETSNDPLNLMNNAEAGAVTSLQSAHEQTLQREIKALRAKLITEATGSIGMLESAVDALFRLDVDAARAVIKLDDEIDRSEVMIEEECLRIIALFHPFARDFRKVSSMLRINADLERVADHATSIAKQAVKMAPLGVTRFPTALTELGQRVPMLCHKLLTSFANEDVEGCRAVIMRDESIDSLEKRHFEECIELMGNDRNSKAAGLMMYRCGRELERVGDLMANIAEDVIYLVGGHIVRHEEKRRLRAERAGLAKE